MEVRRNDPPREFQVGVEPRITMRDCASVSLEPDEQVTFTTDSGTEYDVARKAWGYYATPSTNGRLSNHNLRAALVANPARQVYVMLVEKGCEAAFHEYLRHDDQRVLLWLDGDDVADRLARIVDEEPHVPSR